MGRYAALDLFTYQILAMLYEDVKYSVYALIFVGVVSHSLIGVCVCVCVCGGGGRLSSSSENVLRVTHTHTHTHVQTIVVVSSTKSTNKLIHRDKYAPTCTPHHQVMLLHTRSIFITTVCLLAILAMVSIYLHSSKLELSRYTWMRCKAYIVRS